MAKDILAIALGQPKGKMNGYANGMSDEDTAHAEPDGDEEEMSSYKDAAMRLRDALHRRDDDDLVTAFMRLFDLCNGTAPREKVSAEEE